MGLNSQFNMAQSRVWFDEGAIKVSSAVASVQRGVLDRREHLTRAFRQRRSSARRLTASFQTCHRARIEASTMAWDHINTKPRSPRPERPAMFLVQLHDGGRVMLNLPKNIAALGPCAVLSAALNRQSLGELPAGRIERLVRIR
jgi:hypothetical protein